MENVNSQFEKLNMEQADTSTLKLLQTARQDELFTAISQLRSQGVGKYVSLPQLIVCGNQSSGKSSVLEAISGVPFPTNDDVCTRFAIELMLRRSSTREAKAKIGPGATASAEHKARLDKFSRKIELSHVSGLIEEAKKVMNLEDNGSFCDDVLQIELSGPDMPLLTLIDLPGWIERENDGQTPKDVAISKSLVRQYAKNPRSIILAVIEATTMHNNQAILGVAREFDPDGSRTLGIITKPDRASLKSNRVDNWIKLARNESTHLRLGWHVLKNADDQQRKDADFQRDDEERIFFLNTDQWKTLESDTVGVQTLRARLSRVLGEHIRDQLPKLVVEIERQMEESCNRSKKYGPPRHSSLDKKLYLTELAGRFQNYTRAAVAGEYGDPYFQAPDPCTTRWLRATIRILSEDFATEMVQKGHKWEIHPETSKPFGAQGVFSVLPTPNHQAQPITRSTYVKSIQSFVRQRRGREPPGKSNPILIGEIFKQNSESWEHCAKSYVKKCLGAVENFIYNLLDIADQNVKDAILLRIIEPAMREKRQALGAKINELMKPYKSGYAITYNPLFVSKTSSLGKEHLQGDMTNKEIASDIERMNYHACSELLDGMLAYYAVALHAFVDNMALLAVENCLLDGLENLLSPLKVASMSDDDLERLAAETQDVQEIRIREEERWKVLDLGLAICGSHVR